MFESMLEFLKDNIKAIDGKAIKISDEFSEHHNKDSKYVIKNWLFESQIG